MTLKHRKVLLGITGSIAAYKACELVRLLVRDGAEVQVVMSPAAEQFVGAMTFEALSHRPVRTALFDREAEMSMSHIELARWADAVVIAPASAHCLAKLATGLADDLLMTLCLATRAPILVAPAMNAAMWENPATQEHVHALIERGIQVISPDVGEQACGETGPGRLPDPEYLRAAIEELGTDSAMKGVHAVVTAGPTREPIDPARFISNFSTGRMGCAIADALLERGAQVTLIHGPIDIPLPLDANCVAVTTATEMLDAVMAHVGDCQLLVANAAVADWRPRETTDQKTRKTQESRTLELEPTPDILATLGQKEPRPFLVGFAAETENLEENARTKLRAKNADLMVANRIGPDDGFGETETTLEVVDADSVMRFGPDSKSTLARQLVDHIAARLSPASSVVDFSHAARRTTRSR